MMVLDGIPVEKRPIAVGYFIMDTLRTFYQTGVKAAHAIQLHVGAHTPAQLDVLAQDVNIYQPPLHADDLDMLGDLYKLMVGVSRGADSE